jgi:glycogen debranching enzyme GlgX
MITVFGRRGIGKSALAAKAVEMVARGNTGFSGVVNLSTRTDGTLTIERIFFACAELASPGRRNELNILWASQRDPRDKLTELFTVLEEGRIVVVLDNIEDQLSDDGRPGSSDLGVFFDVIFRAEKAPRVLVTTQVPVVLDPAVLRMHARLELKEGLPVAECVELLRELDRNGEAGLMDSLRYWVLEMHVDGFRFARAAALARQFYEVDRLSAFFDLVQQDPVVSQVKLIAEPWNVGDAGYRVGNFPPLWSEWNGNYRDTVRDFWRGRPATLPEFTFRLTGSSDLYQQDSRRPVASVNFVTCHDGFTLTDLVSYDRKHNQANGEYGRDGSNDNRSWNCGAEGPTDDPDILVLRERQKRNFLATLLLSQGVPMLLAGDEMGRTQRGNNNAYCQDNEISWVDWAAADEPPAAGVPARRRGPTGQRANQALLEFVRWLVRFRADHPVFRRRRFFHGQDIRGVPGQLRDIAWFTPAGQEMTAADWQAGSARSLTVFLNGRAISEPDRRGERIRDDSFLLLFNASELDQRFTLPPPRYGARWSKILDTAVPPISAQDVAVVKPGDVIGVPSRSVQVLCRN